MSESERTAETSVSGIAGTQSAVSGEKGQAPTETSSAARHPSARRDASNKPPSGALPPSAGIVFPVENGTGSAQGMRVVDPSRDHDRDPGPAFYWDKNFKRWILRRPDDPNHSPGPEYIWDKRTGEWVPKPGSSLWTDPDSAPGTMFWSSPGVDPQGNYSATGQWHSQGEYYWDQGRWWSMNDPAHQPPPSVIRCAAGLYYNKEYGAWMCYTVGGSIGVQEASAR